MQNTSIQRAVIIVTGRVQGVGYRYSLHQMARNLNLSGFVKNMPDGSVYIEAEGEISGLEDLVLWCRKGPTRAIVDKADVTFHPPAGYKGFSIR